MKQTQRNEYNKLMDIENSVILFLSPNDISKLENDYIENKKKTMEE